MVRDALILNYKNTSNYRKRMAIITMILQPFFIVLNNPVKTDKRKNFLIHRRTKLATSFQ